MPIQGTLHEVTNITGTPCLTSYGLLQDGLSAEHAKRLALWHSDMAEHASGNEAIRHEEIASHFFMAEYRLRLVSRSYLAA